MANGQGVLQPAVLNTSEVDRLCSRMERRDLDRHAQHAAQLTDALELDRVYRDAGMALQTSAVIALTLRCSEDRATGWLQDARALDALSTALPAMTAGLLTIEQSRVVIDVLGPVDDEDLAARVWERLRVRLEQDARIGAVLPPARLAELLRGWLQQADPQGAIDRRKQAEAARADVDVWDSRDGTFDIAIRGVTGPNAQACAQKIAEAAEPIGAWDARPVGVRRRNAAVDLILGRTTLPFSPDALAAADELGLRPACRPGCGCAQGQSVPCGAGVQVLVPLPTALGTGDVPAEQVGRGQIDNELLQELLLAAPRLELVWVDPASGAPVAVEDRSWTPGRGDPAALRAALLDMASTAPPAPEQRVPVHPDDHPGPSAAPPVPADRHDRPPELPGVLTHPHPTDTPGPYRTPRRLARLLRVRSPRCEWPGCGRRALTTPGAGCDLDHDLAWPFGPTCGCNEGPACRRHHRIKQLGWIKTRLPGGGVRWTSHTGRSWISRLQHQPPAPPTRPLQDLPGPDPLAGLSPAELNDALFDPRDPACDRPDRDVPDDSDPPDTDPGERFRWGGLWTRLKDPTAWHELPPPTDPLDAARTECDSSRQ